MRISTLGIFVVCAALLVAHDTLAQTSELHVVASAGVKPAVTVLVPQIERSIGTRVTAEYDASKTLKEKILSGEAFDVAILTPSDIDDLIQKGRIDSNTRTEVARTGVGVGIRAGSPKPDISTPEALKRALLEARSITLNPNGASTTYFNTALERLGIAADVKRKFILETQLEQLQANVAGGRAEFVIALISEILDFRGVELAGPLPGDLQTYVNFVSGVAIGTHNAKAASALIKFLKEPGSASVIKAKGLEPR